MKTEMDVEMLSRLLLLEHVDAVNKHLHLLLTARLVPSMLRHVLGL
jgi:hypothetical protein